MFTGILQILSNKGILMRHAIKELKFHLNITSQVAAKVLLEHYLLKISLFSYKSIIHKGRKKPLKIPLIGSI